MHCDDARPTPFEWIVNSNALGVMFVSRDVGFRVAFLSRHAVRRIDSLGLLGTSSGDLLGERVSRLTDHHLFSEGELQRPENYPATFRTEIAGRHIEFAASPVLDGDERYLGVMVTFKEVSEEMAMQAAAPKFEERMSELVRDAGGQADEAEVAIESLSAAVGTVKANGAELAKLLSQIVEINRMTKMLSLNANIEASRAKDSEAFTVIAQEMGNLASSIGEIAREVKATLGIIDADAMAAEASSTTASEGVRAMVEIQRSMEGEVQGSLALHGG